MYILKLIIAGIILLWSFSVYAGSLYPAVSSYPQVIMAGDSNTWGYGAIDPRSYPYKFCTNNTSCSYLSKGVGGQGIRELWARWNTDVVASHPNYVIIMIGSNGMGGNLRTFLGYYTNIFDSAAANNIVPVAVLIPPATAKSNSDMRARDIKNASIITLASSYKSVVADCGSTLGQERAGGNAGNLWDIKTAYNRDDRHYNAAGYAALAACIWNAVNTSNYVLNALTVTKAGKGEGTVTSSPAGMNCGSICTYNYSQNSAVTLTAIPSYGNTFTGWSGVSECAGTSTCVLKMSAAKAVTAIFTQSHGVTKFTGSSTASVNRK